MISNGISRITSSVMSLSSESLQLASDLKEVQNVVDTTFNENAKQIDSWAVGALRSFGLAELQAKQYSGTIGAMLKTSGISSDYLVKMSENLTGLAGDFASFYNLPHDQAFEKIRSGISGETEPLKALGINMSVANMEAFALSQGIKTSWNDMDQASQTLLRYNYLMSVSGDQQGDFAKTQGEYANQQRLFDTNMKQLAATIAEKAIPYLNEFLKKGNEFMTNFDIDKAADKVGKAFEYMANTINWARDNSNWLIPAISGVVGAMAAMQIIGTVTKLIDFLRASTIATTFVQQGFNAAIRANPIGLIVTAVGLAIAAGVALYKNWDTIKEKILGVWDKIKKPFVAIKEWFGGTANDGQNQLQVAAASMPAFATGGIATRPSIFGEAGPEMAIPLQRSPRSLALLEQTAQILGTNPSSVKPNSVGVPPVQVIYSPVIQGGGQEVQQALELSFEQFKSWIEQYFEDKARASYG
ncbi:hypothetical protein DSY2176 [Desulfitobacterium hafniense Y51]|uniref:Phage tail tape measure protein n=2 Tax=Desulfitobacterium hafniense TaxID=49338 RepID=Q24VH7_DESHY|nr:hypothetical protein DSY2176 [Desulfitobacterium hafniense Y51]